jgi:hypothetical protein
MVVPVYGVSISGMQNCFFPQKVKDGISLREHSYMTSDVFWVFLTYLPTLIRWFTT